MTKVLLASDLGLITSIRCKQRAEGKKASEKPKLCCLKNRSYGLHQHCGRKVTRTRDNKPKDDRSNGESPIESVKAAAV